MAHPRAVVLKFGSSVLPTPGHVPAAVTEIYRRLRRGRSVVAVVSAFRGRTDGLLDLARAHDVASPHARAALLSTGELEAASLLAGALERSGLRASLIEPSRMGLLASGDPLDATLARVEPTAVRRELARGRVAVVPGYVACDGQGRTVVLGRGGSDLTAVALGDALNARVVLLKDVGWVHEWSPADGAPAPRRFATLSWDDALALTGRAIQPKAIAYGRAVGRSFAFAGLGSDAGTHVGPLESTLLDPAGPPQRRLRVAVLGLGTVGGGVAKRLALEPDRFQLVGVLARRFDDARLRQVRAELGAVHCSTSGQELIDLRPDVLVEAIGGLEPARELVGRALAANIDVVTANKALLAASGQELLAIAGDRGARLRFSAAVGGALPAVELVRRTARRGPIVRIRAVLNGTSNFVLNELARGRPLAAAIAAAQGAGYAEADPHLDLSGIDAAQKLAVLAWVAAGRRLPVDTIARDEIDERAAPRALDAALRGGALRQVATLRLSPEGVSAAVRLEVCRGPWADLPGADNAIEIATADGRTRRFAAAGAGRWPTTESVLADLNDLSRPARRQPAPTLIHASIERNLP